MLFNARKILSEFILFSIFTIFYFGVSAKGDGSLSKNSLNTKSKDSSVSSLVLYKRKPDVHIKTDTNSFAKPQVNNNDVKPVEIASSNSKEKIGAKNSAELGAKDLKELTDCISKAPNYLSINQYGVKKEIEDTEDDYTNDSGEDDEAKGENFRNIFSAENDGDDTAENIHQYNKRAGKQPKVWDQWGKWSCCNTSCGPGKLIRWRHCVAGGCASGEKEAQLKSCQIQSC